LIQIIKMRTSAGFIPSFSAGTTKTRDRSNPPVTAKILHEITKRWGLAKTKWVVELCFDDLLNWNTWMYTRRTETPLHLLSWGSNPFPYAPDGKNRSSSSASDGGEGAGAANLESGLDNGPVMEGIAFNLTGRYVEDEFVALLRARARVRVLVLVRVRAHVRVRVRVQCCACVRARNIVFSRRMGFLRV
jgi:hypothetical protein